MENGIFTEQQYLDAIRHYECVASELAELADRFSAQDDRTALEKAANLLRGLAAAGRARTAQT